MRKYLLPLLRVSLLILPLLTTAAHGLPVYWLPNGVPADLPASATGEDAPDPSGIETVRERIVHQLMAGDVAEDRISTLMGSLRDDGSWPGINYVDTSRTGFEHSIHMSNLYSMSRAYRKAGSAFFENKQLKAAFDKALNYWLKQDFICENWWWNQIGVPGRMVGILLIMGQDHLTPAQWEGCRRIAGRANLDASGARPSGDRIVIAGILAKHLLAAGDSVGFGEVIQVIEGEIKFSTGRGMQYDYSFHHRVDRVNNTLSYGTSYASAFSEWAAYVAGTSYAFSDPALHQLIDYYLDGICKMLAYGVYPDPGAKNRGISRKGALRSIGTGIPERLLSASTYRTDELQRIIDARRGTGDGVSPHTTFFWHSEHLSHQQPNYYTSVRMFSSRNHNMEVPYNSEGLLNHYLGNGSNFISRTGTEYDDIYPVFDFHKIPGATLVQYPDFPDPKEIQQPGITDFVGGVTDGVLGAAAFDFRSEHDSISARKSWFFFEGRYVCLGAGIASDAASPVVTTVNQCLLKAPVATGAVGRELLPQEGEPANLRWIWHDSVGYFFPRPQRVHYSMQEQTGSWYRISKQSDSPRDPVSMDVFKLWIDHGLRPDGAGYEYIVVPGISAQQASELNLADEITILANQAGLQAAEDVASGVAQVVFYTPGPVTTSGELKITALDPGMLMIRREDSRITELTVADPSRSLERFRFSVNVKLEANDDHFTAVWNDAEKRTEMTVRLPQEVYAGKSVSIRF